MARRTQRHGSRSLADRPWGSGGKAKAISATALSETPGRTAKPSSRSTNGGGARSRISRQLGPRGQQVVDPLLDPEFALPLLDAVWVAFLSGDLGFKT